MRKSLKIILTIILTTIILVMTGTTSKTQASEYNITDSQIDEFISEYNKRDDKDGYVKSRFEDRTDEYLNEFLEKLNNRVNYFESLPSSDMTVNSVAMRLTKSNAKKAKNALSTFISSGRTTTIANNGESTTNNGKTSTNNNGSTTVGTGTTNNGGTTVGTVTTNNGGTTGSSFSDLKGQGDKFIQSGSTQSPISTSEVIQMVLPIGRILVGIATIVLVVVGLIFGLKYMMGGADEKANLKQKLIWYIISIVLVYGAVGIFTIVVNIMNNILK